MESRFQDHVVRLRAGGTVDMALVELMVPILRSKLRERGIWSMPPRFLGYVELSDWRDRADLQLLAVDAIGWAIVDRLRALEARIDVGDNVDGFIHRNTDHFLSERQQRADPIGKLTYQWVSRVLKECCEEDVLFLAGETAVAPRGSSAGALSHAELERMVQEHPRWTRLVRVLGQGGRESGEELRALVNHLATGGAAFEPSDLVAILRTHARRWHGALQVVDEPENEQSSRILQVLASRQMVAHLEQAIERSTGQDRRRRDLQRILVEWRESFERGEELNQAALAARLGMKKATVSDHVRRLRQLISEMDPGESPAARLQRSRDRR